MVFKPTTAPANVELSKTLDHLVHPARAEACRAPYRLDDQKRWWISPSDVSDPHSQCLKAYARALLTAHEHEWEVPHFKQLADYLQIIDPREFAALQDKQRASRKRKAARVQALADADDWDLVEIMQPGGKPRGKSNMSGEKPPKRRIRGKQTFELAPSDTLAVASSDAAAAALVVPAMEVEEEFEAVADGCSVSHVGSSSEESSDSVLRELESARENNVESLTEGVPGENPANSGNEGGSDSDSSESSSSSSSDSSSSSTARPEDGDEPAAAAAAGPAPEPTSKAASKPKEKAKAKVTPVSSARDRTNRIEYGLHHMVPRYRDGCVVSYHMQCGLPKHNLPGKRCSRELAVHLAGSDENARRILKAWVLLGHSVSDRDLHMDRSSRQHLHTALKEGTLLPEKDLDALAVASADSMVVAPFCAPPSSTKPLKKKILGSAGKVPRDVHERMEELCLSGGVPASTLEQRQRNKLTGGSTYGVPIGPLQEALHYGYISPNLAPPAGYIWKFRGNWQLVLRGG